MEAIGQGVGEGIDKDVEGLRIHRRSFATETLPRGRGPCALDIEPCEVVLDRAHGLDTAGREAPSTHGQSAHAAFILTTHAHRAGILGRDDTRQPLWTGGLKLRDGLREFLCGWAAAP
jgi:hypothetical protein